jgi:hypothetical protein
MDGVEFVRAEEVLRRPLRVAVSPAASLIMATRDAVGAQRSGTPEAWCASIRTHLRPADYETFTPLATSQLVLVPHAIMPTPTVPRVPLRDELERIVSVADDELAGDIRRSAKSGPTGDWRSAERHPERWVRRFVAALARAWNGFQPVWQLAQESLAREIERVGVAAARDSQLELMDGLLPNARVQDGQWRLHAVLDGEYVFPETGLVLVPMVTGKRGSQIGSRGTTITDLGYPMTTTPAHGSTVTAAPASLEALLGPRRARLLRSLQLHSTNRRLAEALSTVPSAVTHHVEALETAGLVTRERHGRHVVVRRTPRGEALLALYPSG